MRLVAIQRSFLRTPAPMDAPVAALGAWFRLQEYCTSDGQESGRLSGAKHWKLREWFVRANISTSELDAVIAAKLARWDGDDLIVEGFDSDGASKVKILRKNGKFGPRGGRPKTHRVSENNPKGLGLKPSGFENETPYTDPDPDPETDRIGSDCSELSEDRKTPSLQLVPSPSPTSSETPKGKKSEIGPPPVLVFPCKGKGPDTWGLQKSKCDTWAELFPGVDVMQECRKALAWTMANAVKQKTPGGMDRFLVSWLSKAQDSGRSRGRPAPRDVRVGHADISNNHTDGKQVL